jgi:hypothetical protein
MQRDFSQGERNWRQQGNAGIDLVFKKIPVQGRIGMVNALGVRET